ncbi:hypothetical protein M9Y10_013157 [Tritrichomonas musculus]|uniref:Phosphoglycerate mutase family protein n=1 Tax=Tritrichomonas musculus TaxID=1915356 RepID=A0ABR2I7B5_9EUKA
MTKRIILVRHAQSDSNAGGVALTDFSQIPITAKGKEQAQNFASNFNEKPDLIICSPFLRTQQTSQPFRNKYSDVPFELDDNIREFSYINPDFARGTTFQQRRQRVNDYWGKLDPSFHDSESVECFSGFIERAKAFIKSLHQRKEHFIIAFTHSLFMILFELILKNPNDSDLELMKKYIHAKEERNFENCGIFDASKYI